MKILIAGGTGFIGKALTLQLINNAEVTVISRDINKVKKVFGDKVVGTMLQAITWDQVTAAKLAEFDVAVNLTGANIASHRWTRSRKLEILESRVQSSGLIARLCAELGASSPRLLNASAIGIYGLQADTKTGLPDPYTEKSSIDFNSAPDFLARVGRAWERALQPAVDAGVNVIKMRFGVVLDRSGGALQQMLPAYKFGLGGRLGSGRQPFTWISRDDLIEAIQVLINTPSFNGPINLVAPGAVTQNEFSRIIATRLKRPSFMVTPSFLIKLIFGQMGEELLLQGQHVKSLYLEDLNFQFKHPDLNSVPL